MPIRMNPAHDTETPPGQVSWPYPPIPKTLGEVIDRVLKSEAKAMPMPTPKAALVDRLKAFRGPYIGDGVNASIKVDEILSALEEAYADGWRDASSKYGVW